MLQLSSQSRIFPATAKVFLENGKLIKISELQIGDRVQTGTYWVMVFFRKVIFKKSKFWIIDNDLHFKIDSEDSYIKIKTFQIYLSDFQNV